MADTPPNANGSSISFDLAALALEDDFDVETGLAGDAGEIFLGADFEVVAADFGLTEEDLVVVFDDALVEDDALRELVLLRAFDDLG